MLARLFQCSCGQTGCFLPASLPTPRSSAIHHAVGPAWRDEHQLRRFHLRFSSASLLGRQARTVRLCKATRGEPGPTKQLPNLPLLARAHGHSFNHERFLIDALRHPIFSHHRRRAWDIFFLTAVNLRHRRGRQAHYLGGA